MCGVTLVMFTIIIMEYTERTEMHPLAPVHSPAFLSCPFSPSVGVSPRVRFAATYIAGFYTLLLIGLILVLPLFPAQPKLGPVYQHVTQFIPPNSRSFSLFPHSCSISSGTRSLTGIAGKSPVQRRYIRRELSRCRMAVRGFPHVGRARNRFFGTMYLWYGMPPFSYAARNEFLPSAGGIQLTIGLFIAFVVATLTARWGFACANWFRALKR